MSRICTDVLCDRPSKAKGLCLHHYYVMRRDNNNYVPRHKSRHGAGPAERLRTIGWDVRPSGCWEWRGDCDDAGYGRLRLADRKSVRTHRVAWESTHGSIPENLVVRHKCDNPPCVNPEHLLLGTHQDNDADRIERDRTANGERIANYKLTDVQVARLRADHAAGRVQAALARQYGVSQSQVSRIVRGINRHRPTVRIRSSA